MFVVDSSSSIYDSDNMNLKLRTAWYRIFKLLGSDDVYFSVYSFNDEDSYIFKKWEAVWPNIWKKQLKESFIWTRENQGVYSFGQQAICDAIKQSNPLNLNPSMRDTLTVVLITDGGLTEAAEYGADNKIKKGDEGAYESIFKAIAEAQEWRKAQGWPEATICTVGLENLDVWSISVKRPDNECQMFLKELGKKYNAGYFLVRNAKRRNKVIR